MAEKALRSLAEGRWGLERARRRAREIEGNCSALKALVEVMFGEEQELRKRAADVARRITDSDPTVLWRYADELAGLLAELSPEEQSPSVSVAQKTNARSRPIMKKLRRG